jgi:hypothetical protein
LRGRALSETTRQSVVESKWRDRALANSTREKENETKIRDKKNKNAHTQTQNQNTIIFHHFVGQQNMGRKRNKNLRSDTHFAFENRLKHDRERPTLFFLLSFVFLKERKNTHKNIGKRKKKT